jgi:hypothetical protein
MSTNLQKAEKLNVEKQSTSFSDKTQLVKAEWIIDRILDKEETLLSRIWPSAEARAKREKNTQLISQALGHRNEMYRILRETQLANFLEAANVFLSDKMIQNRVYLAERLTQAINDTTQKMEAETERFLIILQKKADTVDSWGGSLGKLFKEKNDTEIRSFIDAFYEMKFSLLSDLHKIKDNLIKKTDI